MSLSLIIGAVVVVLAFAAIVVLGACFVAARHDARIVELNE